MHGTGSEDERILGQPGKVCAFVVRMRHVAQAVVLVPLRLCVPDEPVLLGGGPRVGVTAHLEKKHKGSGCALND